MVEPLSNDFVVEIRSLATDAKRKKRERERKVDYGLRYNFDIYIRPQPT